MPTIPGGVLALGCSNSSSSSISACDGRGGGGEVGLGGAGRDGAGVLGSESGGIVRAHRGEMTLGSTSSISIWFRSGHFCRGCAGHCSRLARMIYPRMKLRIKESGHSNRAIQNGAVDDEEVDVIGGECVEGIRAGMGIAVVDVGTMKVGIIVAVVDEGRVEMIGVVVVVVVLFGMHRKNGSSSQVIGSVEHIIGAR